MQKGGTLCISMDELFGPFVNSGKENGTGLRLAIARQAILDHSGSIVVEIAEGKGTT